MKLVKYSILLIIGFTCYSLSYAEISQPNQSTTNYSANQHSQNNQHSQTNELSIKATQWGLKVEEWQRYQALMDGPLGIYSPNLDPLTALGISARSDEERRYYAELQVTAEMQRVSHELAYQRAYDAAFKRMYPNLLPVEFTSNTTRNSVLVSNNRLAVFVRDNCKVCETKVKQLQQSNIAFDIYMVDSKQDDFIIRQWASKIGIDPKKVFAHVITLNHDAGRWQALAIGGELPAVVKEVGGKWQRQ